MRRSPRRATSTPLWRPFRPRPPPPPSSSATIAVQTVSWPTRFEAREKKKGGTASQRASLLGSAFTLQRLQVLDERATVVLGEVVAVRVAAVLDEIRREAHLHERRSGVQVLEPAV